MERKEKKERKTGGQYGWCLIVDPNQKFKPDNPLF